MSNITVVGIDLAKNIFQVQAENAQGEKLFNRPMKRATFIKWMQALPPCIVGMEACGMAHYWGREFVKRGHQVKLINPRKVKAFLGQNKNDQKDAEAICEAVQSRKVLSIPVKTIHQQNLTSLHRARSQVVKRQTQVSNHLRSQLAEMGFVTKKGYAALMQLAESICSGETLTAEIGPEFLFVVTDLMGELTGLKKRLIAYDNEILQVAKDNATAKKLLTVPGVGKMTATALAAKVDDFRVFKKGSDFSAWLGLTPKEYSSAGKQKLGSISKQGDRYLRTLLIHGARSVVNTTLRKAKEPSHKEVRESHYHRWIRCLVERSGKNITAVALANKHARMIWAMMRHDRDLDLNFAESFLNVVKN